MTDEEVLGPGMTYSVNPDFRGSRRLIELRRMVGSWELDVLLILSNHVASGDKLSIEAQELVLVAATNDRPIDVDHLAGGLRALVATGWVFAWDRGKKMHFLSNT